MNDTKILLNVLVLYIPLPVFWALFDQQGSRWTFQASRMDGDLGFYEIKPDQMQVVNPLLILLFIPLYDVLFYPLLSKVGIRRPLQKLTLGGILAGVAFLCSGIVELQLEYTYPVQPIAGESQLRIFNTLPCDYNVVTNIPDHQSFVLKSMESYQAHIPVNNNMELFTYEMNSNNLILCPPKTGILQLNSSQANSFYIRDQAVVSYLDNPSKSSKGDPILRILANTLTTRRISAVDINHKDRLVRFDSNTNNISLIELYGSNYEIYIDDYVAAEFQLKQGSVSTLLIADNPAGGFVWGLVEISQPNTIHMLWLLPQYIIMTLGEVMYSITGLAFSYAQAPVSMKSVLQACWLLTVAFGNVIDIIVVGARAFESQVKIYKLSSLLSEMFYYKLYLLFY